MKKFSFFVFINVICTISYAISDTTEASLLDLLKIDTNSIKNTELSELYIKDSSLYLILDSALLDNNDSLVFYDISFHQYSETTCDLVIQKSDDAVYYLDIFYGYIYYKNNYFVVTVPRYIEYYNLIFEKSDNKKRFYMNWNEFKLIDDSPEKMYRYKYEIKKNKISIS
ncbi:MAG: hypothetical protein IJ250_01725, partial [Bacteroidales bacterium]|nr:hypothetical protein [Bacteroidales bacterium]